LRDPELVEVLVQRAGIERSDLHQPRLLLGRLVLEQKLSAPLDARREPLDAADLFGDPRGEGGAHDEGTPVDFRTFLLPRADIEALTKAVRGRFGRRRISVMTTAHLEAVTAPVRVA